MKDLIQKYDVPVPRYTSYPTVPYWSETPTTDEWIRELKKASATPDSSWSLYIHIPYCETLCTFCGCNTVTTKDHTKESPYVETLLKEFHIYKSLVPELMNLPLKQIHLGGGTPTFLSAEHLEKLLKPILAETKHSDFEGGVEVDPRRTTVEQLKRLRDLGFSRVSMGIQDFDEEVQRIVNRYQPYEVTARLTKAARELGYSSVNYDLIYGLPKQNLSKIKRTVDLTIELRPERIALYSFALVPWIKPAQRLFKDEDLPRGSEKRELYEVARDKLVGAGYIEIGMDHFALPNDALAQASIQGTLHRNFMGYTDQRTSILLGIGVSSISETPTCFHQNEKVLPVYERLIGENKVPTLRGHLLNDEDRKRREQILKVMTNFEIQLDEEDFKDAKSFLAEMEKDGLVSFQDRRLIVKEKAFLRNICMAFDSRLRTKQPEARTFSQAL